MGGPCALGSNKGQKRLSGGCRLGGSHPATTFVQAAMQGTPPTWILEDDVDRLFLTVTRAQMRGASCSSLRVSTEALYSASGLDPRHDLQFPKPIRVDPWECASHRSTISWPGFGLLVILLGRHHSRAPLLPTFFSSFESTPKPPNVAILYFALIVRIRLSFFFPFLSFFSSFFR